MRRRILRLLLLMFAAFILPACAGSEKAAESENEMFDTHTKQFLKYAENQQNTRIWKISWKKKMTGEKRLWNRGK